MSEPTGPAPFASEGWPPAPPMNPNPVTEPYPAQAPMGYRPPYQAPHQPQYQQVFIEKSPQQLEGEKLSKTSTILGIVSIYFAGFILGPMAIVKAAKAEKLGVDSTVGQVTGWLGVIFGALSIVVAMFYILVFGAIIAASEPASDGFNEPVFGNSKNYESPSKDRMPRVVPDATKEVK